MTQIQQLEKEHVRIGQTAAGSFAVTDLHDPRRFVWTTGKGEQRATKLYSWWSRLDTIDEVVEFWETHGIAFEAHGMRTISP